MTGTYLDLYTHPQLFAATKSDFFLVMLLGIARILPIIALAPFFGAKVLNAQAKIGLGILIYLAIMPKFLAEISTPLSFDLVFAGLVCKELVVGFLIGFLVAIPFYMAESAGTIIDQQRGASSLMVNDPILQNQNSPMGVFFNLVGICLFFYVGGPYIFLDAMEHSFSVIPPDKFLSQVFFTPGTPFYEASLSLLNSEMSTAVRIASPSLVIIFMTDMFLGLANRLAPQVMITFLGLPMKSFLGIMIVMIAWSIYVKEFSKLYLDWLEHLVEMIESFGIGLA